MLKSVNVVYVLSISSSRDNARTGGNVKGNEGETAKGGKFE
jgi:hypothetical protein